MKDWIGETVDQLAHAGGAIAGLTLAALFPSTLTFAFAGLCMGLVREITEEQVRAGERREAFRFYAVFSRGSLLDLAGWTFGGLLVGLVAL